MPVASPLAALAALALLSPSPRPDRPPARPTPRAKAQPATRPAPTPTPAPVDFAHSYVGGIRADGLATNWVEVMRPHSATTAQSAAVSTIGFIGQLAATRTSDNACTGGCQGSIALAGIANNDNVATAQRQTSYAGYFEGTRRAGAGTTHGIEVNTANFGDTIAMSPVAIGAFGITPAVWLAAGAGYPGATNSSAAIGIIDNGARFEKGIVFSSSALAPRRDARMEALSLASRQAISFYDSAGNIVGNISSAGAGTGRDSVGVTFGGGKMVIENDRGAAILSAGQTSVTIAALLIVPSTPASSTAVCTAGQITADSEYVYVCTAPNRWKRSTLAAF